MKVNYVLIITIFSLLPIHCFSSTCLKCSQLSPSNYFCNKWMATHKNTPIVECCEQKDRNLDRCQTSAIISCSNQFKKSPADYFQNCPGQSMENCGLEGNYEALNIYAQQQKVNFTNIGLKHEYSVCSYKLLNPPGGYQNGFIYLKFQ